jgi:hypothetical protein
MTAYDDFPDKYKPLVGSVVWVIGCFPIWGALIQWMGVTVDMPTINETVGFILAGLVQLGVTYLGVRWALEGQRKVDEKKEKGELAYLNQKLLLISFDILNEKRRTEQTDDPNVPPNFLNFDLGTPLSDLSKYLGQQLYGELLTLRNLLNVTKGIKHYQACSLKYNQLEELDKQVVLVSELLSTRCKELGVSLTDVN